MPRRRQHQTTHKSLRLPHEGRFSPCWLPLSPCRTLHTTLRSGDRTYTPNYRNLNFRNLNLRNLNFRNFNSVLVGSMLRICQRDYAIISISHKGTQHRFKVRPGSEGFANFQHQLNIIAGTTTVNTRQLTFHCSPIGADGYLIASWRSTARLLAQVRDRLFALAPLGVPSDTELSSAHHLEPLEELERSEQLEPLEEPERSKSSALNSTPIIPPAPGALDLARSVPSSPGSHAATTPPSSIFRKKLKDVMKPLKEAMEPLKCVRWSQGGYKEQGVRIKGPSCKVVARWLQGAGVREDPRARWLQSGYKEQGYERTLVQGGCKLVACKEQGYERTLVQDGYKEQGYQSTLVQGGCKLVACEEQGYERTLVQGGCKGNATNQ
eukprot:gene23572-9097_t